MAREKKKSVARWKKILLAIFSVVFVFTISALIVIKVFVIKTVKVEGNVLYDEELIKSTVLNDEYSWNSLYVLLKYTFSDDTQLPFIDTIEVEMENPTTLNIVVYEKGMMGYLYIPAIGENAYFDKDGFVVETSTRVIENVPKVEGLDCSEVVLYEKLPIDNQTLKELLTITQAFKSKNYEPETIYYGVKGEPVLEYGSIKINLGSTKLLTQKVERIIKALEEFEGRSGTLHLENWTGKGSNIVFDEIK